MTILFTAMALAAAPTPVQPAPQATHAMPAQRAQQTQPGAKPHGDGCACCKDMSGGAKMDRGAKHGEGHGGDHAGQKANR